ncbi:putative metal homeostasis protein [Eremococcus coleocola]|nr:putative metal homeostasis protein [Eremococcus coleocola]
MSKKANLGAAYRQLQSKNIKTKRRAKAIIQAAKRNK